MSVSVNGTISTATIPNRTLKSLGERIDFIVVSGRRNRITRRNWQDVIPDLHCNTPLENETLSAREPSKIRLCNRAFIRGVAAVVMGRSRERCGFSNQHFTTILRLSAVRPGVKSCGH